MIYFWEWQTTTKTKKEILRGLHISHSPCLKNPFKVELVKANEALKKTDIILILVPHKEFKKLNFSKYNKEDILDVIGLISDI